MHEAAFDGDAGLVRVLLRRGGADLTLRNGEGQLAVEIAVQHGHFEVVKLLKTGWSAKGGLE